MKLNLFLQAPLIGLDVQPTGIYLVQLRKMKRGFLIERAVMSEFHETIFAEGKIKYWETLRFALIELVHHHGLHGMTVAIQLPANLVRMQQIQVPLGISDNEIEAEVYACIQKELPGTTDILSLDYVELPQKVTGYSSLFFAAARKDYLFQYVECVNAAGLKVKIADIDIYALKRAICFAEPSLISANGVNAIQFVINDIAGLIVFDAYNIQFYQHWDMTETIDFSTQLRSKIQLFLALFQDREIQHLIICDQKNNPISRELMNAFTFQIHSLDVFSHLDFDSSVDVGLIRSRPNHFMVATGLAMREVPRW